MLLTTCCVAVLISAAIPGIWSQYRDGGKLDFRGAAEYLATKVQTHDSIVSDQHWLLAHYLAPVAVTAFSRDTIVIQQTLARVSGMANGSSLWIVAQNVRRGGFNERDLGQAFPWVSAHCRVELLLGTPRLDYDYNELQIYRCPAHPLRTEVSVSGLAGLP